MKNRNRRDLNDSRSRDAVTLCVPNQYNFAHLPEGSYPVRGLHDAPRAFSIPPVGLREAARSMVIGKSNIWELVNAVLHEIRKTDPDTTRSSSAEPLEPRIHNRLGRRHCTNCTCVQDILRLRGASTQFAAPGAHGHPISPVLNAWTN